MEKPGYYGILPADVRYDETLSSTAKLLYAEITALSNVLGYCVASNNYFGRLYGLKKRQMINIINELRDKKYIRVEMESGKRKIFVSGVQKIAPGGAKNYTPGGAKNCTHNNTSNNIIYNNNIYSSEQNSEQYVLSLPLNDKSEYPIMQSYVSEMQELYPNVDVVSELKKMRAWCINNPRRRKTKSGICKFINGWLSRMQDKGSVKKFESSDEPSYWRYVDEEE